MTESPTGAGPLGSKDQSETPADHRSDSHHAENSARGSSAGDAPSADHKSAGAPHGDDLRILDDAIGGLRDRDPALAATLTRLFAAVALEASRGPRFANSLTKALRDAGDMAGPARVRRPQNRRNPGPLDPFAIYAEGGEDQLRTQLAELDLEALRDIIAEHGMDTDRLAMKWKDSRRVVDRIVERVADRSTKGAAFRH